MRKVFGDDKLKAGGILMNQVAGSFPAVRPSVANEPKL